MENDIYCQLNEIAFKKDILPTIFNEAVYHMKDIQVLRF